MAEIYDTRQFINEVGIIASALEAMHCVEWQDTHIMEMVMWPIVRRLNRLVDEAKKLDSVIAGEVVH